jgi:hypothetical protein
MLVLGLVVIGVFIGLLFYGYTRIIRRPSLPGLERNSTSTGMTSGPVNQTRAAGIVPKVMPVNIRTGHEEDEELV